MNNSFSVEDVLARFDSLAGMDKIRDNNEGAADGRNQ